MSSLGTRLLISPRSSAWGADGAPQLEGGLGMRVLHLGLEERVVLESFGDVKQRVVEPVLVERCSQGLLASVPADARAEKKSSEILSI